MTSGDKRAIWERYVASWQEPTAQGKLARLEHSVDEACVYRDPTQQVEGHAQLVDYMLAFHQQLPGGHFETTYFLAHHERSIARWNMRDGSGSVVGEGISYGEYGAHGKLLAMTGFFEVPPV